jgi:8-oxo-dGTP pyrophosphatase MutT (NUDIX family)
MIGIKIVPNDVSTVAKVILFDSKKRILLLKRSSYVEKYANEWDLPGGHLKENENMLSGLKREVFEETGLKIREPIFFKSLENLHFFTAFYDSQPVKLSHEHTNFKFFEKNNLDPNEKFQKICLEALAAEEKSDAEI